MSGTASHMTFMTSLTGLMRLFRPKSAAEGGFAEGRVHPLLMTAAVLITVCNLTDTGRLLARGWFSLDDPRYALMGVCSLVGTACLAVATPFIGWMPYRAARAVCGIWLVMSCLPASLFTSSWTLALDILFALVVTAHGNVLAGQVAVDLCVLLPLITGTIADVVHPYYMMVVMCAIIMVCLNAVMAIIAAAAMRRRRDRDRWERDQRLRREQVVHQLHDDVANRLSYVLLRLQHDARDDQGDQDGRTASRGGVRDGRDDEELIRDVRSALRSTRQAVRVLSEGADAGGPHDSDAGAKVGVSAEGSVEDVAANVTWGALHAMVMRESARLERIGCNGTVVMPRTAPLGFEHADLTVVAAFLRECYANIAKHADPARGYALAVSGRAEGVVVSLADTSNRADVHDTDRDRHADAEVGASTETPSTGRGLAYYRGLAERCGGSLTIEEDTGEWSLTALFPC